MRTPLNPAFLVPLLLISLTSCGFIQKSVSPWGSTGDTARTANRHRIFLEKDGYISVRNEIAVLLEKKNYLSALSTLRQEVEKGHSESALANEYRLVLRGVLGQAEALMSQKNLDEAGIFFRAALDGFPREEHLAESAPLSKNDILARMQSCAAQLMEEGLLAYRSGNLDTAIGMWEKILVFQPQHEASQKAIHTANLQLANLKSMDHKKSSLPRSSAGP